MNTFDFLINNLDKEHKQKLIWFFNNKGKKIEGWLPTINGQNLASKAKGIYKPKDNQYALSVRSSLSSHYEDKLMRNDNGKFLFHYFQENLNPKAKFVVVNGIAPMRENPEMEKKTSFSGGGSRLESDSLLPPLYKNQMVPMATSP